MSGRPEELTVAGCKLIDLPVITNPLGNIAVVEGNGQVDFDIARVFYVYDVPPGSERGGHAHHALHEVLIAVSGSLEVELDDGNARQRVHLDRAHRGLRIAPMVWRQMTNFSPGAVCLVLASDLYDENDYVRDRAEFRRLAAELRLT